MEGPSFYCAYLNFTEVPPKSPNNMAALQLPVKELYFKYRGSPQAGRSASVKLTLTGLLIILYEGGKIKAEIFFEFSKVQFVEAIKFSSVRGSSEKKPKAMFLLLSDERTGHSPSAEKSAFPVEKNFHYLVSSTHPPLVVCVVKRPHDAKAIDCHVFALDTVENAFLLVDQIRSRLDGVEAHIRPPGGGGDVIRTDYGEYSVYRGHHQSSPGPTARGFVHTRTSSYDDRELNRGYDENTSRNLQRGMDYQQGPEPRKAFSQREQASPRLGDRGIQGDGRPGRHSAEGLPHSQNRLGVPGGVILTQEDFTGPGYAPSPPRSPRNARAYGYEGPGNPNAAEATSGAYGMVQMRRDDIGPTRGQGYRDEIGPSPLPGENSPRFSGRGSRPGSGSNSQPVSPRGSGLVSPRGHNLPSPTSPLGPESGPVFSSASNLESRFSAGELSPEEPPIPGKPVAKVPPHMKAGIKVLPTDFRGVKLKHNPEKKPSEDESHADDAYDNDKGLVAKYRAIQEKEDPRGWKDSDRFSAESGRFRENPESFRRNEPDREYLSAWSGAGGHPGMMTPQGSSGSHVTSADDPNMRSQQGEISQMFADFRIQSEMQGSGRRQGDRNVIEHGLGYLP